LPGTFETKLQIKNSSLKQLCLSQKKPLDEWPHTDGIKANIRSKTTAHRPQKKKLCNSHLAAEADISSCGQRWYKKGKQLHPRRSDTQHAKAQRAQT